MKAGYLGLKQTDTYTGQQAGLFLPPVISYCLPLGIGETETRGKTRETQIFPFCMERKGFGPEYSVFL